MSKKTDLTSPSSGEVLILGECSGIQNFIFNVQSKGASKTLKARSLFILALPELAISVVRKIWDLTPAELNKALIYNAGGNFLLRISGDEAKQSELLKEIAAINARLVLEGLQFVVAIYNTIDPDYKNQLRALYNNAGEAKLMPLGRKIDQETFDSVFRPVTKKALANDGFKKFIQEALKEKNTWLTESGSAGQTLAVDNKGIRIGNHSLTFGPQNASVWGLKLSNSIHQILPKNKETKSQKKYEEAYQKLTETEEDEENPTQIHGDSIVPFELLAVFAGVRTGTNKLGILKVDVDDAGKVFQNLDDVETHRLLSSNIKGFFSEELAKLLNKDFRAFCPSGISKDQIEKIKSGEGKNPSPTSLTIQEKLNVDKEKYRDHIYTVFAGGDDCFLVGGWDAVLQFGFLLRKEFGVHSARWLKDLGINKSDGLTFSAAFIMVDGKFPVSRFSFYADENLHKAKTAEDGEKDKLNMLGWNVSWRNVDKLISYHDLLVELHVVHGFPRGLFHLLQTQTPIEEKRGRLSIKPGVSIADLAKLYYSFRDMKELKEMIEDKIIKEQERLIIKAIQYGLTEQMTYWPLAARWAELSTKNFKKE